MTYKIAVLAGDGIGPDVTQAAVTVLEEAAKRFDFQIRTCPALIGGAAIDQCGEPLPHETIDLCKRSDAVLLGAVGGPKWDALSGEQRPEKGLLRIREALELFANLRPATVYPALRSASPLKDEILGEGLDLMVVRELTGGIYFGKRGREEQDGTVHAFDTEAYSQEEIRRILKVAFEIAERRRGKLCSVDKANVLETSRLWRETAAEMAARYPKVELSHLYVDNAAMQLVRDPRQFDTMVTGNMFGDILSDEASQITGSIGMLPSASLGTGSLGLYEPIHGSAPDLAGRDIANPIAAILSVAMMLQYSLTQSQAAKAVEQAVDQVLEAGIRTADLAAPGQPAVGTKAMTEEILSALSVLSV